MEESQHRCPTCGQRVKEKTPKAHRIQWEVECLQEHDHSMGPSWIEVNSHKRFSDIESARAWGREQKAAYARHYNDTVIKLWEVHDSPESLMPTFDFVEYI